MDKIKSRLLLIFDSAEALDKYRESIRFYLKIDLGYILALGAVVSFFRFSGISTLEAFSNLRLFALFGVVLLALNLELDLQFFEKWLAIKNKLKIKRKIIIEKLIIYFIKAQPLLHFILVGGTISFIIGYASAYTEGKKKFEVYTSIQEYVELFNKKENKFPDNFEELTKHFPKSKFYIDSIAPELTSYVRLGEKEYELRFSGRDGILNTEDDVVGSTVISLQKIKEVIYKSNDSNCDDK